MPPIPPIGHYTDGPKEAILDRNNIARVRLPAHGTNGRRMYIFTLDAPIIGATLEVRCGGQDHLVLGSLRAFCRPSRDGDVLIWRGRSSWKAQGFVLNFRCAKSRYGVCWNLYRAPVTEQIPSDRHWSKEERRKKNGGRMPDPRRDSERHYPRDYTARPHHSSRQRGRHEAHYGRGLKEWFWEFLENKPRHRRSRQQEPGHTQQYRPPNHRTARSDHHRRDYGASSGHHRAGYSQRPNRRREPDPASWQRAPGYSQNVYSNGRTAPRAGYHDAGQRYMRGYWNDYRAPRMSTARDPPGTDWRNRTYRYDGRRYY